MFHTCIRIWCWLLSFKTRFIRFVRKRFGRKSCCDKTRKDTIGCRQMEIRIVNACSDCFAKHFISPFLGCSQSWRDIRFLHANFCRQKHVLHMYIRGVESRGDGRRLWSCTIYGVSFPIKFLSFMLRVFAGGNPENSQVHFWKMPCRRKSGWLDIVGRLAVGCLKMDTDGNVNVLEISVVRKKWPMETVRA